MSYVLNVMFHYVEETYLLQSCKIVTRVIPRSYRITLVIYHTLYHMRYMLHVFEQFGATEIHDTAAHYFKWLKISHICLIWDKTFANVGV